MTISDQTVQITTWMMLGQQFLERGQYSGAEAYFSKVIAMSPNHWQAIYEKGKASAWQSPQNLSEFDQGLNQAMAFIEPLDLTIEEQSLICNLFAMDGFKLNNAQTDEKIDAFHNETDLYVGCDESKLFDLNKKLIENIQKTEQMLQLITSFKDERSRRNSLEMKKRICKDLVHICFSLHPFWVDEQESGYTFLGLDAEAKKPYIEMYTELIEEIHQVEPNFGKVLNEMPDPFDAPAVSLEYYEPIMQICRQRELDLKHYWEQVYLEQNSTKNN